MEFLAAILKVLDWSPNGMKSQSIYKRSASIGTVWVLQCSGYTCTLSTIEFETFCSSNCRSIGQQTERLFADRLDKMLAKINYVLALLNSDDRWQSGTGQLLPAGLKKLKLCLESVHDLASDASNSILEGNRSEIWPPGRNRDDEIVSV